MHPMNQNRRQFIKKLMATVPSLLVASKFAMAESVKPAAVQAFNLDFVTADMDILRRDAWTQILPRTWLLRQATEFEKITVHHVGKSKNFDIAKKSVVRDLDGVLNEHMDRSYGDIGYHFIVDYAGRLWEGRSLAFEGAHVSGQNDRNIGIVCLGNFDVQQPSEAQLITVEQIISVLREHYGIKQNRVFGHCDLGPSACPGEHLYPRIIKLRE